jgi:arsenate reductase (thioredoxin)
MPRPKVLFLCTGNSARSQMAEAFLRAFAGDRFEVHSAGIEPKGHILPDVLTIMNERGLNLNNQRPKGVKEYLGKMRFAYVITVCADAEENCPAVFLNMGKHEHWPFDDPAKFEGSDEQRLQRTRDVRDQIERRVYQWLDEQDFIPAK